MFIYFPIGFRLVWGTHNFGCVSVAPPVDTSCKRKALLPVSCSLPCAQLQWANGLFLFFCSLFAPLSIGRSQFPSFTGSRYAELHQRDLTKPNFAGEKGEEKKRKKEKKVWKEKKKNLSRDFHTSFCFSSSYNIFNPPPNWSLSNLFFFLQASVLCPPKKVSYFLILNIFSSLSLSIDSFVSLYTRALSGTKTTKVATACFFSSFLGSKTSPVSLWFFLFVLALLRPLFASSSSELVLLSFPSYLLSFYDLRPRILPTAWWLRIQKTWPNRSLHLLRPKVRLLPSLSCSSPSHAWLSVACAVILSPVLHLTHSFSLPVLTMPSSTLENGVSPDTTVTNGPNPEGAEAPEEQGDCELIASEAQLALSHLHL